ncbi:MAG: uroporphyrinogen-III synthase [Pasteurellaceae bacterium]|nr:uroporphyrinogen-III synthase [Pasteurellaceae bacterium]
MAVLITRPGEKGKHLAEMLNKVGIATLHLPFFSIIAGRELNDLPLKFKQLNQGDYVLAVSHNAIEYANQTLRNAGFHWRSDLYYFAVGQTTAEYFASKIEQAVQYPYLQENSEGLLTLTAMQQLKGKHIFILRGNGGREYFSEQAILRGATLEKIECYQRQPIHYDNIEQTSICKRAGIDRIVVTSLELLNALFDFVPENERGWLLNCQLITVSQRIANIATQMGWQSNNVIIAPRADNTSLLNTILQFTP